MTGERSLNCKVTEENEKNEQPTKNRQKRQKGDRERERERKREGERAFGSICGISLYANYNDEVKLFMSSMHCWVSYCTSDYKIVLANTYKRSFLMLAFAFLNIVTVA